MDVYWLEQTEADVPTENDWLNASEVTRLNELRFAKRRADWRLGRWTAKRAVAVCLNLSLDRCALAGIEIRPAPSGAPEVFLANTPAPAAISLSHRAGTAVCAVVLSKAALGCDLEIIEPHSDAFVSDYFTSQERDLVARARAADRLRLLALLWSAKESMLKALRVGLRLDTRSVIVSPVEEDNECAADTWRPLHVRDTNGKTFHGWWRHQGSLLRTLVADAPLDPPLLLEITPAQTTHTALRWIHEANTPSLESSTDVRDGIEFEPARRVCGPQELVPLSRGAVSQVRRDARRYDSARVPPLCDHFQ